jgi:hypothetical protein
MTTPTTPPTAAQADAFAQQNGVFDRVYALAVSGGFGQSFTQIIVFYMQEGGTIAYLEINDPTRDFGSMLTVRGLVAMYGGVIVRSYTYTTAPEPTDPSAFLAADSVQSSINDPAQWVAAP